MSGVTIYGDCRSGGCLDVRWTADHLGIDYDWIEVGVIAGSTRTEEFLALNPSGQVPTVIPPDGRSLAQSNAIRVSALRAWIARNKRRLTIEPVPAAEEAA